MIVMQIFYVGFVLINVRAQLSVVSFKESEVIF